MLQLNDKQLSQEILAIHPTIRILCMFGYTANVIAHHGVLEEGMH